MALEARTIIVAALWGGAIHTKVPELWNTGVTSIVSNRTWRAGLSIKFLPIMTTLVPPEMGPLLGTTSNIVGILAGTWGPSSYEEKKKKEFCDLEQN